MKKLLTPAQIAPESIHAICGQCGNARIHARTFFRGGRYSYECPSCGHFADCAEIEQEDSRRR